uniref:Uncharacterized protein n=1 Tax=viral metagenome TaxID=1070528 RepID=A0A6C0DID1_9ZZZZ
MANWYSVIYKAFIFASVISFIIYNFTSGNVSLGAMISGLEVLGLSIIMILYIILYNVLQTTQNSGFFQSVLAILNACGPFILMLASLSVILYLVITYKNNILLGHVSNSYYTFSNIAILFILLQVYIIYNNVNTTKFEITKKISNVTSITLYLFGVITTISSITLFTILKNYSADG